MATRTSTDKQDTLSVTSAVEHLPGSFPHSPLEQPTSNQLSLSQAIHARRLEYVRPKTIRIKVGTWNTASCKGTEQDVGSWFVESQGLSANLNRPHGHGHASDPSESESVEPLRAQEGRFERGQNTLPKDDPGAPLDADDVGLYLLGLQEVVDVGSASENFRPYTDPEPAKRWKAALEAALPEGYVLVAEQQLIGLLLLVYASPDVAPDVKAVSTTSVGTGLMGYMGNKGAVTARLVLGDTTRVVFVNSHLAAGADKAALDRRNWDYNQIMTRTKFEPIRDAMSLHQSLGETIDDADFTFWTGDLNYRLADIPAEDVRRLLTLHTKNEYDDVLPKWSKPETPPSSSPTSSLKKNLKRLSVKSAHSVKSFLTDSTDTDEHGSETDEDEVEFAPDPASLQTTLDSLLPHDELHTQMKLKKAFHEGWQEGPITFLPTYKYDPGSVAIFDSSEKKRGPSWCDRIVYRTRRDKLAYDATHAESLEAAKKDAEMKKNGLDQAGKDEELLYDYDPEEDAAEAQDEYDEVAERPEGVVITKEGFEDEIHLETYTAHQRVLSSDHKPLDAVFKLKYDYVVPELKTKIHEEVVRELDKAENEGRPSITVVVDKHYPDETDVSDSDLSKFEGVDFGHVRYATRKRRTLTIANTGRVAAEITFVDRPMQPDQEPGPAPKWLKIIMDPDEDEANQESFTGPRTLEPGDVCNVELRLRVLERRMTKHLNDGTEMLDDILVLRVENGRDHFIPLHGKWLPSTLGRSIDKLIRIPEGGIRKLQGQKPKGQALQPRGESLPVKWSAPRELFRLTETVEKLTEVCVAEWEMTSADKEAPWMTTAGWPFAKESWTETSEDVRSELTGAVSEALDTGESIESCMPPDTSKLAMLETVALFLIEYLESIPDGIITETLWPKLEAAMHKAEVEKQDDRNALRTTLEEELSSSPPHSISFILLTSSVERIISEQTSSTLRTTTPEDFKVPPALTRTLTGSMRRKTVSKDPRITYRRSIVRGMAQIFANATVRAPEPEKQSDKAALEEQKIKLVELFICRDNF